MLSYQYKHSHYGGKTVSWPSYLFNGNPHTWNNLYIETGPRLPSWLKQPHMSGKHDSVNSLRPRLNRRPFADDIFKSIFLNENEWISPRISLKFVPKVQINNIPAWVQIMAWRRSGGKPLSEPMMVSLLMHICVTRPQWVNTGRARETNWMPDHI